jgi:hypothetical protein
MLLDAALHRTPCIVQRQPRSWQSALSFEQFVSTVDLLGSIGIVGRSSNWATDRNQTEFLEVFGNDCGPVVGGAPRFRLREIPWPGPTG